MQPIADVPLAIADAHFLVRLRDKTAAKRGRRLANYVRAVLSLLFGWACERGYVKSNPAILIRGVKRLKNAPRANRPLADEDRFLVLAEAPTQFKPPIGITPVDERQRDGPVGDMTLHVEGLPQTGAVQIVMY